MNRTVFLLCLAMVGLLSCGNLGSAEEVGVRTGKQKQEFDLKRFKSFIDDDLSRPKPECSLADMGIPARRVEGQLVDHAGNPLADVAVAIVEPIGYSGHCYFDNFDTTDREGRFVVDGSVAKTRLVFRESGGKIWLVNLDPDQKVIRVLWPQPAKVTLKVPQTVATAGQSMTIQTRDYFSGISVMRHSAQIEDDGTAVFEDVIPSDYFVTIERSKEVAGELVRRSIGIADFKIEAGEQKEVDLGFNDGTTLVGQYSATQGLIGGNRSAFVLIDRDRLNYLDQSPLADFLTLDENGGFRSRPLSPGHYHVKVLSKGMAPVGRFGNLGGDMTLQQWRVVVDGSVDSLDLESISELDPIVRVVENALADAANESGSSRGRRQAEQLKKLDERNRAEQELLRILSDPLAPYQLRRAAPLVLQAMTDSPSVVIGLLQAVDQPVNDRERRDVIAALQSATIQVDEIIPVVARCLDDTNHITRGIATRTLGELAVKNLDHAKEIAKLLERSLDDPWEATRLTAADHLGRIDSTNALPALLRSRDDVYGPVAVMAAFSAWKIGGDPEYVYPTMTEVLHRKGIAGMWEAAYFMSIVAEKYPVPDNTQGILRRVATMAGKPPFKSSYHYEQSRVAKAAQKVLEQIAKD